MTSIYKVERLIDTGVASHSRVTRNDGGVVNVDDVKRMFDGPGIAVTVGWVSDDKKVVYIRQAYNFNQGNKS